MFPFAAVIQFDTSVPHWEIAMLSLALHGCCGLNGVGGGAGVGGVGGGVGLFRLYNPQY